MSPRWRLSLQISHSSLFPTPRPKACFPIGSRFGAMSTVTMKVRALETVKPVPSCICALLFISLPTFSVFTSNLISYTLRTQGAKLFFFFKFYLFIWLLWVPVVACGIQLPDQGSNLGPLHWELRVLATGPPGKPHQGAKLMSQPIARSPSVRNQYPKHTLDR